VQAVSSYPDLLRMAIAAPGNDFRLGAMEAPPAIISTYLGQALTDFLATVRDEQTATDYAPLKKTVNPAPGNVAPFTVPAEDRNRTSPFPYGGHRFEFRAVGSSQNVSMVNTALCSAIAESFNSFAEAIEAGRKPLEVSSSALKEHWNIIFNGNGYGKEWPPEAEQRGLHVQNSGVEATQALAKEKNIALFKKLGVMEPDETAARCDSMHVQYSGMVEIEAKCMIDMIKTMVLPVSKECGLGLTSSLESGVKSLEAGLHAMESADSSYEAAKAARVLRLETMEEVRAVCDEAEGLVPADKWPLSTYKDLLFLDFTEQYSIV
jgi:glutamine synthetase